MPRGTWMPLPRPFGLAPLVIVLQQAEHDAVVVPVVEEDGVADAAFLSEAHLPCEGQAPLVLRVGPPTDAVEVQLLESLLQQEADDLRAEALGPVGLLRDREADVARRGTPRPLVDADPAPADRLAARLLLDDVVPVRETLSLDRLVVPREDGLHRDRVVGGRSREAHQLLVILPFVEELHVVPLERPERHQLAGQHADLTPPSEVRTPRSRRCSPAIPGVPSRAGRSIEPAVPPGRIPGTPRSSPRSLRDPRGGPSSGRRNGGPGPVLPGSTGCSAGIGAFAPRCPRRPIRPTSPRGAAAPVPR